MAFEFVEALASGFNFRKVTASRVNFIAMRKQLRAQTRECYHPSRMARLAIMPDIPSHAAQIASVTGEPLLVDRLVIIDRPIDASSEPLNLASQVKPIKPMFNAPVQPLTGRQPHGVLSVRENGEPGGGPTSGAAKSGTNPLTCEIVEIAYRGEDLLLAPAGFDPAEYDLEILALMFRACGFDKRPIEADDHMFDGLLDVRFLDDFGSRFCFDRFSHCQNTIAGRSVIETGEIREKFVQDVSGLPIGKLAPQLDL
ncbi:MAG: hypothetical protein WA156_11765 [Methylocystis silviterrae]